MKKLLFALALIVVALVAVGFVLPSQYRVERDTFTGAKPAAIHALVGDLSRWDQWDPWRGADPELVVTPGHKSTGVGASQSWVGASGSGSLVFTASSPESGVAFNLDFQGGQYRAVSRIDYTPAPAGTTVRWTMEGDGGSAPLGGYMALFMKYFIGTMYEQGLEKLKTAAESSPK